MTPQSPPAFADPWHAQLFAITVHLSGAGLFTWPEWAARFGASLRDMGCAEGGDDYYLAWLSTLEHLLQDAGQADAADLATLKAAWAQAYLDTAHGAPVHLPPQTAQTIV